VRGALLDPLADERWKRLAATAPAATIFHDPRWLALLARRYRYPVAGVAVLDGTGAPVAGLPLAYVGSRLTGRRLVALPFSDACPPLLAPGAPVGALDVLAATVERERARRGVPLQVCAPYPQLGMVAERYLEHAVDLRAGPEAVMARQRPGARRHVRKAERAGLDVVRGTDAAALDAFYALHLRTRRRLGVPIQPRGFIRDLEGLMAQGGGFVAVVRHAGRSLAAAVFLRGRGTLTYKYGGSDERFLHLRPNNLLFARVLRWACDDGLDTLDLGRTDPAQPGLAAFKRSLGARERPLAYTYAGGPPPGPDGSRLERLGGAVIRHTPAAVGRVAGELLYRHAG
jgi:CelD/BcsL family acetyltransferase involved in cellulose biosynthesis